MDRIARIADRVANDFDDSHDIDIVCFYDNFLSEEEFKNNFQVLYNDRHGDAGVLLYGEGTEKYPDELLDVIDYDAFGETFDEEYSSDYRYVVNNWYANNIVKAIKSVCTLPEIASACDEEFENWEEFEEWIKDQDEYSYGDYEWLWDILPVRAHDAVLSEAKKNVSFPDWQTLLSEINFWRGGDFTDIGLQLKEGWQWVKSRGYSQGDACIVICRDGDSTSEIDNMLWDAPVTCIVTVDGDQYYVDSEMKDRYSYSKEEAVNIMKKLLGDKWDAEIADYLNENMPENPDYE